MDFLKIASGLITSTMIAKARELVQRAAVEFLGDATRREYAVESLMRTLGVSEHIARLLVELVVFALKHPDTVIATD